MGYFLLIFLFRHFMKNIRFMLLLMAVTQVLMAQNSEAISPTHHSAITNPFGIKAGYLQTDLHGSDMEIFSFGGKTKSLNSFILGVEYNSEISRFISLKHELSFKMHGAEIQLNDEVNGTYNSTLKMNSLELQPIHVALRYKWLQLYAGPYASALIHAHITRKDENGESYKDKSIFGKPDEETDENKYLQKMDFGATAGLQFEFNKTINIGIRYNHGLVPLFDNTTEQRTIRIYNKSWGITLGVNI